MISASDISSSYREFCKVNYIGRFRHFYPSLESQVEGKVVCELCQGSMLAEAFGACEPEASHSGIVDLLFTGSPCDPFSQQRSKRFADGSVANHYQFDVTMLQVVKLYSKYEPIKAVFEQVRGFTMPFSAGGTETPKDRRGVCEK